MIMGDTQETTERYLTVDRQEGTTYRFERVGVFTYLGVKIDDKGHEEKEKKEELQKQIENMEC